MTKRTLLILLAAVLIALALFLAARSCAGPVYAPTPTPTFPAPPTPMPVTINAPTVTPKATATGAITPIPATETPISTEIPQITPVDGDNPTPTGTPDLLGHHRVARGETMYGIGLWWYRGRYLAWGDDVWRGICDANPQIDNCRMIYPGDVLAIPAKR